MYKTVRKSPDTVWVKGKCVELHKRIPGCRYCRRQTPTGQINMKLQSAITAFGSLCLLFAHGFPVSEYDAPKIIGPLHSQIKVDPGEHVILHCDALPNCDEDEALIYWLINGTFPEESPSHDRIIESNESSLMEGLVLQKHLILKNVTLEDFSSSFSCVVTNAVGMAQKFIKLADTDCSGKQ